MASDLPQEGDVLEGTITRIEPYGAFCGLEGQRRPIQGLIHISQLAIERTDKVEDVVSVGERVWVKVLSVEMDPSSQRRRIRLSRKDVSQDGLRTDLTEELRMHNEQRDRLETNLNSMIGMGIARDPMSDRLTLKGDNRSSTIFRGGYTLVGDDEGEPNQVVEIPAPKLPSIGRGRGTTLPAWMTHAEGGPTGMKSDEESERVSKKGEKKKSRHSKSKRKRHERKHSTRKPKRKKRRRDSNSLSETSNGQDEEDSGSLSESSHSGRHKRRRRRTSKSDRRLKGSSRHSRNKGNTQSQDRLENSDSDDGRSPVRGDGYGSRKQRK